MVPQVLWFVVEEKRTVTVVFFSFRYNCRVSTFNGGSKTHILVQKKGLAGEKPSCVREDSREEVGLGTGTSGPRRLVCVLE